MAENEDYFPRGGKKPVAAKFFKQNTNFLGAPEKTAKKKKRPKKNTEGDDGYLSDEVGQELKNLQQYCAPGITHKTIKEGLLILGRVQNVSDTKVKVSLPSKIVGTVMACHISEAYNKQLEAYVNDQIDKVRELQTMFRPGQYVATKVLEVDKDQIMLSFMPQHVNGGRSLADVGKGIVLQAAVVSAEDHGYVMDIGVPNTKAFLPMKNVNPDVEMDIGTITWCCITSTSPETSVVTLSADLEALNKAIVRKKTNSPLLPGTPVLLTVDKPLENGIEGSILGDMTAYVKRNHATAIKGKKPGLGQKVKAYLLYVMPPRRSPFLTMRSIFEAAYPDLKEEQKLLDGDVVEDAQVLKITGRSVIFRLSAGSFGSMSLKRVQVSEDLTDEQVLAKSYPVGSSHKVRILQYNLSDHLYSVSDDVTVLEQRYFSIRDAAVGELVDGVIRNVGEAQLRVGVGRLVGVVPHSHMSDAGYYVDPKKAHLSKLPKKKFKEGKEIKARILSVDPVKNILILTVKPSLLNLSKEGILAEYKDAVVGKAYTGVIKYIRNDYLLVSFFNHVTAIVTKSYVTKEDAQNITQVFHLGQIVNCTIIKVDVEAKKMAGSLVTPPFWPNQKPEVTKRKQNDSTKEDQEVIPNKKRKTSESKDATKEANTDKLDKTSETKVEKKKKDKKQKVSEIENKTDVVEKDTEVKQSKKKKEKITVSEVEYNKLEEPEESKDSKKKKKKKRTASESSLTNVVQPETTNENKQDETEKVKDSKKKKDKKRTASESSASNETQSKLADENKTKSKKEKKKKPTVSDDESKKQSEESDAIETDIYEDETILSPRDQGLVDLSDCETLEQYRKRSHQIRNSIEGKRQRIIKINVKIKNIESKGLTPKNKKFHTAMHSEKLILEQSIELLESSLQAVRGKCKELDNKQEKKLKRKDSLTDSGNEEERKKKKKKEKKSEGEDVLESKVSALQMPSVKDFWRDDDKQVAPGESSSSDDEQEEQPKKKRKKLSVAEKLAKVREEEARVREMEDRAMCADALPRSCEQFERAILAAPENSQLWIAYMAFHLQSTEVDKARAVGKRALTTISFRNEQEKLNVWLALINVEIRFGTKETQQKTIEDAVQLNEPYSIHSSLLDMYLETGQLQELSTLVDLMMRKYRRQPESYVACGSVCYKGGLVEKARQVMQKAIAVLDKKDHVSVLVQFALLEHRHGSRERSEAIFEQIAAVYPKRVDVTCAYADMLVKCQDVDRVRQVMERMTSQKLPARKMKVLYKKWIEIEEKMGSPEEVENIRQRALDYIEKAKF